MHGLSEMDAMVSGILQEFVLVKKKKINIKKKVLMEYFQIKINEKKP